MSHLARSRCLCIRLGRWRSRSRSARAEVRAAYPHTPTAGGHEDVLRGAAPAMRAVSVNIHADGMRKPAQPPAPPERLQAAQQQTAAKLHGLGRPLRHARTLHATNQSPKHTTNLCACRLYSSEMLLWAACHVCKTHALVRLRTPGTPVRLQAVQQRDAAKLQRRLRRGLGRGRALHARARRQQPRCQHVQHQRERPRPP